MPLIFFHVPISGKKPGQPGIPGRYQIANHGHFAFQASAIFPDALGEKNIKVKMHVQTAKPEAAGLPSPLF